MNLKIQLPVGETVEVALSRAKGRSDTQSFVFEQIIDQYYLPDSPPLALSIVVLLERAKPVLTSIFPTAIKLAEPLPEGLFSGREGLLAWAEKNALACLVLDQPLSLLPIKIAKPWGAEIWFTGIEARGQSAFLDGLGFGVPLPWLLSVFPRYITGAQTPNIILLKILAPLAEPVYGDLYFEMHEKKQEVYVVTDIDRRAWPDGVGGIRFGFCQTKRAQYSSDADFRAAYLASVKAYEKIRREIDVLLDDCRRAEGVAINAPVDAAKAQRWNASLPSELCQLEVASRGELDSFSAMKKLTLGDVVKVPCYTPHSLQHGVTTVEFQTPVYERKILSFAQKVLTQSHWDTESALKEVSLEAPLDAPLPVLLEQAGVLREEVVRFDDFVVERISLVANSALTLTSQGDYALIMAVDGSVTVENHGDVAAMQARLIPASMGDCRIANQGADRVVYLYAYPIQAVN